MYEMKYSGNEWLGDIPSRWQVLQLGSMFEDHKQKNIGLVCDNLLSLSYGKIKRKDINGSDGLLPESFEGYNIIDEGDIVLRLTDLQNDHRSLRVGLSTERGIITSAYVTLRKRKDDFISNYFYYLLHSYDIKKGFYGMGAGVRQGLNYAGVSKIPLCVPSKHEQQKIIAYINQKEKTIDALITNELNQIEKLTQYKQSIISEVAIKGLNPFVSMQDSGLEWVSEIPHNWETTRLKALFTNGKGLPITKEDLRETGIPVISYGQIHSKSNTGTSINDTLIRYVDKGYLETNSGSLVRANDFIFADTSEDREGCGNCVYVDRNDTLFAGYHTIILFSRNNESNKYLAYLFMTDYWRSQIRKRVSGVKLFSISRKILLDTTVIVPPESEQKEIVEYLDRKIESIDKLISIKQAKIEKLNQYKKTIIYEYVTGKKEVACD